MVYRTPNNSTYELVGGGKRSKRSSNEEEDLVCCTHGAKCNILNEEKSVVIDMDAEDEEEGHYVNLMDQSKSERENQLKSLKKQLGNLDVGKNPRQKKTFKEGTIRLVKKEDLDETGTIPPYNSIYETVGNRKRSSGGEKVLSCCVHGSKCCHDDDQLEENREDLLNSIKKQLKDLEIGKNPRQKKDKKKKKDKEPRNAIEVEDEVFPRKPIRVVEPQNESNNKNSSEKKKKKFSGGGRFGLTERTRAENAMKELLGESSDLLWENYIGAMAFEEAEQAMEKDAVFRLYHRLESPFSVADLEIHSSLYIVFRSIHGYYRHYPIRKRMVCGQRLFYVEYGNPRVEGQPSLQQLILYYQNNAETLKFNTDIGSDL